MNLLVKHHDNLWKQSRKQLKHFLISKEQSSLHHFRTSVKQLNTLSHLLNFIDQDFDSVRYMKRVNKIFERAGELRDDYVTEQLSKKYAIDTWLSPTIKEVQDEYFETLKKSYRTNATHSSNAQLKGIKRLEEVNAKELKVFAEHIRNKIATGISSPETLRVVHQIRKDIKEYLFTNKLLELKRTQFAKPEEVAFFEKLQNLVGDKHDLEKLIRKTNRVKLNPKLQTAIDKIIEDEKQINQQILSAFKKYSDEHKTT